MAKRLTYLAYLAAVLLAVAVLSAQGPLTPWANLMGRTDSNGYLMATSGAYAGPDGPLTPMANLRVRTDSNGYLITTLAGSSSFNGPILLPDGTSGAPALAFASEPTLGLWRSAAGMITLQGNQTVSGTFTVVGSSVFAGALFNAGLTVGAATNIIVSGRAVLNSPADGEWRLRNNGDTTGAILKFDALPTVASGFGTSPAVTAGSTPLAGSVNVGTGGTATSGVVAFNGTAFPSAPFCVATDQNSNIATRVASSTTQLTLTVTVAWGASDVVNWICISSK